MGGRLEEERGTASVSQRDSRSFDLGRKGGRLGTSELGNAAEDAGHEALVVMQHVRLAPGR